MASRLPWARRPERGAVLRACRVSPDRRSSGAAGRPASVPGYRTIAYDQRRYGETAVRTRGASASSGRRRRGSSTADRRRPDGASSIERVQRRARRSIDLATGAIPSGCVRLVLIGARHAWRGDRGAILPVLSHRSWSVGGAAATRLRRATVTSPSSTASRHTRVAGRAGATAEGAGAGTESRALFLTMIEHRARVARARSSGPAAGVGRLARGSPVPTLVLVGDLDVVCHRPASTSRARSRTAASSLVARGHLPHLQGHPRCLAAVGGEFLASCRSAAGGRST